MAQGASPRWTVQMPDKRVNGGFLGIIYAKLGLVSIDQRAVGHLLVPDICFMKSFVVHNRIFEDGRVKTW